MDIKTTMRCHLSAVRRLLSTRLELTSVGANKEKIDPCALLMEMYIGTVTIKTVGRVLEKLKMQLPCDQAMLLVGIDLKKTKQNTDLKRYLHSHVHCCFVYNRQNSEKT